MRVPVLSLLGSLGLRRIVTIVLTGSFVGVVVGYAAATLSNEGEAADTADRTVPEAIRAADARRERNAIPILLEAVLVRAATASGQRRRRARVQITVRLRNPRGRPSAATAAPVLLVAGRRVRSDPAAAWRAAALLKPVPSNTTVSGVLRFETAGDVTDRLVEDRRARLRIAGLTLPLPLKLDAP
ncbi:MAG TPA: hypothetical protein VGV90_15090 [Solirubrobacteraceae bacterium]|nr:hypothetical protein [Solirubrobacteraceae bacterium]